MMAVPLEFGRGPLLFGDVLPDRADPYALADADGGGGDAGDLLAAVLAPMAALEGGIAPLRDAFQQLAKFALGGVDLEVEEGDAGEFLAAVAEIVDDSVVDLNELQGCGIDQADAVLGLGDDAAIDFLADAQGFFGRPPCGNVDDVDDEVRFAVDVDFCCRQADPPSATVVAGADAFEIDDTA